MKFISKIVFLSGLLLAGCGQESDTAKLAESSVLTTVETEVETPAAIIAQVKADMARPVPFDGPIISLPIDIDKIFNIAKQVWDIILANRGVATVQTDYANAFPQGILKATELSNFSSLQFKTYNLKYLNSFGQEVASVDYTLVHQYGGNYKGQGKYLNTVSVIPSNIHVTWGFTVNFKTISITTFNKGDEANPVAGLVMQLQLDVNSIIAADHMTKLVEFNGDNALPVVTTP